MKPLKYYKADRPGRRTKRRAANDAVRVKMHITKGDLVVVISGDDKGKRGKVLHAHPDRNRVTIEGAIARRGSRARRAASSASPRRSLRPR